LSKLTSWALSISFGIAWYVLSLWFADPILDRIFAMHSDDFPMRFAALGLYTLASIAAGNCYVNLTLGIHSLLRKKSK
jgi:hypothetical protein